MTDPFIPLLAQAEPIPWLAWSVWLLAAFALVYPGLVAYLVWAERKVAARFQDRIGPNRVGPFGLLQSIADFVKMVTKEDLVPRSGDRWVHLIAPVILLISSLLALAVIPIGPGRPGADGRPAGLVPVDLPSGLLYLIAVSSLSSLGVFLAGWSSRNKYALLGAMRAVAQLVSYEIPQVLATVPVILWAGSLSLVRIMNVQADDGWYVASPPGMVSLVILVIASIAEVNRTPFDLPEAESELIAGFHTEYSGMRWGLFFLAEYMNVFTLSCLASILFLGGGTLPGGFPCGWLGTSTASILLVNLIAVLVFSLKVGLFIFAMFWIRATLPRLRVDQLMAFAWKGLVPLAILNLPIAAVWFELVLRPVADTPRSALLGWIVTGAFELIAVGLVYGAQRLSPAGDRPQALPSA